MALTGYGQASVAQAAFGFENWSGYYTISADGKFKACFTEADYSSGSKLQFWLTPDQELFFSLKQRGRADPNQKTARIWVDDAAPTQTIIEYFDPITVFAIGGLKKNVTELFEAIRMGNILSIEIGGTVHTFSLRGTYGALSELLGCANLVRMGQPPPALVSERRTPPVTAGITSPPATFSAQPAVTLAGSSSAFAVSSTGHLLTNAHAVEGCRELKAANDQGDIAIARVLATDQHNDLALLAVRDISAPPVSFRKGLPRLGEPVYAYGFPLRSLLASSGNFTAGMVSALVGMKDDSSRLQISAPIQPGNSGGPLLDARGAAVGRSSSMMLHNVLTTSRLVFSLLPPTL